MPRKLLRRWLPSSRRVRELRLLAWLGPAINHPRIWHISRGGIASGAAVGVFFGLLVPVAQIPVAAAVAVAFRANLPMAIVCTLITNPLTFAPLYYSAYRLGLFLVGDAGSVIADPALHIDADGPARWFAAWSERFVHLGKPLFVGLIVMACGLAAAVYWTIDGLWRSMTLTAWHRRTRRHRSAQARTSDSSGPQE